MKTLFAALKGKVLYVIIVVLATLLAATYIDRGIIANDRDKTKATLVEAISINDRLIKQNKQLAEDLKNKPNDSIKIVKESSREICSSTVKSEAIKNLPSTKREVTHETATAGMDDRLPDDLIRVLGEATRAD
ncbi:hypothetical protein PMW_152 [Pseudomonas phage phiPMW]|uniref:Uncharacterized protein n=1 Tax=Pseudomonas phage phiPMW TaxID=1815582 RepID=A0A1S5R1J6_9CAUD|nr:hypothetical protein FDG97_gp198 [Pseudomonas phage phiPMW]ANA49277.1 hypothetical protein PMW_152 [Pseudomonas phage phiPMW]